MSFSTVTYTGNGATTVYNVPFPYLSISDVNVQVNGTNVSFSWLTSSQVQLAVAPANGATVYVVRNTAISVPVVTFVDGSTLRGVDLNSEVTQLLYSLQEGQDQTLNAINAVITGTGQLPVVNNTNNGSVLSVVAGAWATTPASSILVSPLTTKGDVWVFGSANSRLGVGANNTMILADSAQALGVKFGFLPAADSSITSGASGISVALNASGGISVSSGLVVTGYRTVSSDPGSPTDGDSWYNTTTGLFTVRVSGQTASLGSKLGAITTDGAAITNSTGSFPFNLNVTLPANSLKVGQVIRVTFAMAYSSTGTPTWTTNLYFNSTSAGGAAITCAASGFVFGQFFLTVRSVGTSGTLQMAGIIQQDTLSSQPTGPLVTVNTTISNTISVGGQWSAAAAGNTITLKQLCVEKL